ncbi:Serine/threonine-protein kinase plk1, partial [Phlyctochytrium bullatum]
MLAEDSTDAVVPLLGALASQTEIAWRGTIDPNSIQFESHVSANLNCSIQKGTYNELAVIVKRSLNKEVIQREIGFLRRANTSEFVVTFKGWFEEVEVGIMALVMQKCAMTLREWSDAATRSPPTDLDSKMFQISADIAKGLAHINNLGIIHNDLKPDNVFVDKYSKPYIGDFGVATNKGEPRRGYTERCFDKESLTLPIPDEKSDSWLLGATLWAFWCNESFNVNEEIYLDRIRDLDALASNNSEEVRRSLRRSFVDVDSTKDGLTGLQFACQMNLVQLVKILLEFGADCFRQDANGQLPIQLSTSVDVWKALSTKMQPPSCDLFDAAKNGDDVSARLILAAMKDPLALLTQQKDISEFEEDWTGTGMPLHFAAAAGHVAVCRLFLQIGAEIDGRNDKGETPLMVAAWMGHLNVAEMLVTGGADVNGRDEEGQTPLHHAAYRGHEDIVRFFLENGAEIEARDNEKNNTPLILAAWQGHVSVVQVLVEKRADIEGQGFEERTPLLNAAFRGHLEVVRLLLANGADIESRYEDKCTALILAARSGHLHVTQLLVEKGANLEARGFQERTPLSNATLAGELEVVRFLLESGADIESRDDEQCTPLILAANKGHLSIAQLLVEKGADLEARGFEEHTPLHIAALSGHLDVAAFLIERGANIERRNSEQCTSLMLAARSGRLNVAQLLVAKGANIEGIGFEKRTPLLEAAICGQLEVARFLIDKGANIESRDEYKNTPLILAASKGHLSLARLLVEKGAAVGAKDMHGKTARYLAMKNGHRAVA